MYIFLILLFLLQFSSSVKLSYKGYHHIKIINPQNENLRFLQKFETEKFQDKFRILEDDLSSFFVHPHLFTSIQNELQLRNIHFRVESKDIEQDFLLEQSNSTEWFEAYHNYDEMVAWLESEVELCGGLCSLVEIGRSFEDKPLLVMKITANDILCKRKQQIWIDAGIHAREWISHTTAMYLIHRLINDYDFDEEVRNLRNSYDWYILPNVNPDGYQYTWTTDRLWRKSRQVFPQTICIGTDINRNFDFQWLTIGASYNPCSDIYAGPEAFSEPESKSISDFVLTLKNNLIFITLHSYGQLFMSPWGYTKELPSNYPELERVGIIAVNSIYSEHQTNYTFGSAANILYESSGTSRDWAAGVALTPYVYTIELRNKNSFILPPTEIVPTGEEIWAGVRAAVHAVALEVPPYCG